MFLLHTEVVSEEIKGAGLLDETALLERESFDRCLINKTESVFGFIES